MLRLSPDAFWRMTPREFALALRVRRGGVAPAPSRAALDELMRRFPDG